MATPTTALNLKRIDAVIARKFRAGAALQGMTHNQYLGALVKLHEVLRLEQANLDACNFLDAAGLDEAPQ
jgi:hypothetical protein